MAPHLDRLLRALDENAEELVEQVEEQLLDHLIYGTPLPVPPPNRRETPTP